VPAVFPIVIRTVGDVTVVDLRGHLMDDGDIPLVECVTDLIQRGRLKVLLNLKEVTRIDSTGIGIIVAKYLSLRRLGGDLKLVHVSDRGRHLLAVTKLSRVIESFDSEQEALRSFGTRSQGQGFGR
jgi:anti-sigma B factor antagonist